MEAVQIIENASLAVIVFGLFVHLLNHLFRRYARQTTEAQSVIRLFTVLTFLGLTILYFVQSTAGFRLTIVLTFLLIVIPLVVTFFGIWSFVTQPTMSDITRVTYISWLLSILVFSALRILFGWGTYSTIGVWVVVILSSVINGLFGAVIGHFIFWKKNK